MRFESFNAFSLLIKIDFLLPNTVVTDLFFFIGKKNEVFLLYLESVVGLRIKYVSKNKARFSLNDFFVEFLA